MDRAAVSKAACRQFESARGLQIPTVLQTRRQITLPNAHTYRTPLGGSLPIAANRLISNLYFSMSSARAPVTLFLPDNDHANPVRAWGDAPPERISQRV